MKHATIAINDAFDANNNDDDCDLSHNVIECLKLQFENVELIKHGDAIIITFSIK